MSGEYKKQLVDEAATLEFGKDLAHATFVNPDNETTGDAPGTPSIGGIIHLHGDLGAGKTKPLLVALCADMAMRAQ